MKENKIPVVKIHFYVLNTLVFSAQEYEETGKWKGFLRDYGISIKNVDHIEKTTMSDYEFAKLGDWEG
jgi:hypothetical protein